MADVGDLLAAAMSENYINYFNFDGRSYQVIPQVMRGSRLNSDQLLNFYLKLTNGSVIPLSTIARLKTIVVPESINHFQQLNSATISAVPFPGITMGDALQGLQQIAKKIFPENYNMDYAAQSRQYQQESSALILTFFLAPIIIFLCLAAQFEIFRDPIIILVSVPMSICGALIFISLGIGGVSLNIYTEVGLVTLIGLISKHGILIVQFANDLQQEGHKKLEAIQMTAGAGLLPSRRIYVDYLMNVSQWFDVGVAIFQDKDYSLGTDQLVTITGSGNTNVIAPGASGNKSTVGQIRASIKFA